MGLTKRLWREGGEYFWHEMRRSLRLSAAVVLVLIGLSVFAPASGPFGPSTGSSAPAHRPGSTLPGAVTHPPLVPIGPSVRPHSHPVLPAAPSVADRAPAAPQRSSTFYSANWGGYVHCVDEVAGSCLTTVAAQGVTGVQASWQVPNTTSTSLVAEYASTWVGIGGWVGMSDLVQAGLLAVVQPNGATVYEMWWEMLPAYATMVTLAPNPQISAGDTVYAAVAYGGTNATGSQLWAFTLRDATTASSWQATEVCGTGCTPSGFGTAEWIQESPMIGSHTAEIPAYSSFSFVDPEFSVNGSAGSLLAPTTASVYQVYLINSAYSTAATVDPSVLYPAPNVVYIDYLVNTLRNASRCCGTSAVNVVTGQKFSGSLNLSTAVAFTPSSGASNLAIEVTLAQGALAYADPADATVGLSVAAGTAAYSAAYVVGAGMPSGVYSLGVEVWYLPSNGTIGGAGSLLLQTAGGPTIGPAVVVNGPTVGVPTALPLPGRIDAGQNATFTSGAPAGGTPPYTYSWIGYPPSTCGVPTGSPLSWTCATVPAGTYLVTVTVRDASGTAFTSPALTYVVAPRPSLGAPVADRASADVGQTVTFNATPVGGSAPFQFNWTGLPAAGCTGILTGQPACALTSAANLTVRASLVDAAGLSAESTSLDLPVLPAPAVTPIRAVPRSVDIGQSVDLSVNASGGSGGYRYAWAGLPPGCGPVNLSSLVCRPSTAGVFPLSVTVTDSNGGSVTATATGYLVAAPPVVTSFSARPAGPALQGQPVTLEVQVANGSGGLTYLWSGLPPGCSAENRSTLTCAPSATGTWTVGVTVVDSNGVSATAPPLKLTVVTSVLGLPAVEGYAVLAGILLAAVAATAGAILGRRRRRRPPPQPVPAPLA